jgi:hypothetical protein
MRWHYSVAAVNHPLIISVAQGSSGPSMAAKLSNCICKKLEFFPPNSTGHAGHTAGTPRQKKGGVCPVNPSAGQTVAFLTRSFSDARRDRPHAWPTTQSAGHQTARFNVLPDAFPYCRTARARGRGTDQFGEATLETRAILKFGLRLGLFGPPLLNRPQSPSFCGLMSAPGGS